jgi:2-polyprenyl-6-methoxyphenol hydroxylase-like FAD-dependent oxidoreductase
MPAVPRVIIAGAGIAGLAAALRLAQLGWQPLIVERAPARRSDGYLINLAGEGLAAADRLGVLPALHPHHLELQRFTYFNSHGRRRFSVGNAATQALLGPDHLTLMRGELEAVLHHAVRDRAEIRFGTQIRAVSQDHGGVHVTLTDGATLRADLLIGADGLHSSVRELVFASETAVRRDLGQVVAAFLPDKVHADVTERTVATIFAPGRTVAVVRLSPDRAAAIFTYRSTDPTSEIQDDPQAAVGHRYPDLDWLMPDLSAQLHRATSIYFDTVSQIVLDRWSRGRVVLLGDAAWCLSLFSGAGAAMALTGADLLGTLLHRLPDLPAALTAWESELRPRTDRRQQAGRRNATHFVPAGWFQVWLGQIPIRLAALPAVTPLLRRRSGL